MAALKPFRAERYDEATAGPLGSLVAPPYDVISPEQRLELLARSPHNVVHLTLPDSEEDASRALSEWREAGVLTRDEEPAFWALSQTYVGPDGVSRTRNGLVASLRVEPYDRGTVLPHERTHAGPKEGRLRLLRATRTQLEPIFLLHHGDPVVVPQRPADVELDGERLWRLDDPQLGERFRDLPLLIADGHHRYETALAFHAEDGTEASAWMMVVLVSTRDEGLTIFPTHRVAEHAASAGNGGGDVRDALAAIEHESRDRSAVVVYRRDGVAVVHGNPGQLDAELVESLHPEGVSYTAVADEAIDAVDSGRAEAAFLLRPPLIEDVFRVAEQGRVMPQKSTYFYPKLTSGLLFHPIG
jgi:uncharacterized protein (DUF1015 family)